MFHYSRVIEACSRRPQGSNSKKSLLSAAFSDTLMAHLGCPKKPGASKPSTTVVKRVRLGDTDTERRRRAATVVPT
jgi:hypothetical protein